VGKEYDVEIEEVGRRGDGIARVEGFVIFVPSAKSGQHIRVKILQVSERFAIGEIVEAAAEKE